MIIRIFENTKYYAEDIFLKNGIETVYIKQIELTKFWNNFSIELEEKLKSGWIKVSVMISFLLKPGFRITQGQSKRKIKKFRRVYILIGYPSAGYQNGWCTSEGDVEMEIPWGRGAKEGRRVLSYPWYFRDHDNPTDSNKVGEGIRRLEREQEGRKEGRSVVTRWERFERDEKRKKKEEADWRWGCREKRKWIEGKKRMIRVVK